MSRDKKFTELSELGEFGLIKHLTNNILLKHSSTVRGIGDDAAVLNHKDKQIVVTTDLLVEGIHFDLVYCPLKHLGYKAIVVNLSDVYAMNAEPKQVTVSIAVSTKFSLEMLDELYDGILLACENYHVDLIGGDTSSSLTGLLISVTAIGEVGKDMVTYRNTAKDNDLICVSGDLGGAYMGLQLLEREKLIFNENPNQQPQLNDYEYIIARQLKPEARHDVVELLREKEIKPTAMIDISDGLSSEILHICNQSAVGCRIFEEKIPIASETRKMAQEFDLEPLIAALNGGEDYELLFTIKQSDFVKLKDHPDIAIIGHICEASDGTYIIAKDGTPIPIIAQGWDATDARE